MRKEEIQAKIGSSFESLRKSDGTKYKGDRGKALNGALYSTGIFHRENDQWSIRESELESYERKMRLRLESKGKRKRMSMLIKKNDYSLNPSRYVGYEDDNFNMEDFEKTISEIGDNLNSLFSDSIEMDNKIKSILSEIGYKDNK